MKINFRFEAYAGSIFEDEFGNSLLFSKDIKDKWLEKDGRKGKIIYSGYISVYEQGYSGGYENYRFIFQDDLTSIDLKDKESFYGI